RYAEAEVSGEPHRSHSAFADLSDQTKPVGDCDPFAESRRRRREAVDSQLDGHVRFTTIGDRRDRRTITLQGTPPSSTYLHRSKAPHLVPIASIKFTTTRDPTGFR